jgi:hypothetical protein
MYPNFIEWQKKNATKLQSQNEVVAGALAGAARGIGALATRGVGAVRGAERVGATTTKGAIKGAAAGQAVLPQGQAQQSQPQQMQQPQPQPQPEPEQDSLLKKAGRTIANVGNAVGEIMTSTSGGMENPEFSGKSGAASGMSKMGGRGRFREFVDRVGTFEPKSGEI